MAMQELTVWGTNRPGNLAKICTVLAKAKINISGFYASDAKGRSAVRLLLKQAGKAKAVLRRAGFRVEVSPALIFNLTDRPGALARASAKLARNRVNINYGYATVSGGGRRGGRATIVLGVKNPARARRALR
jgi:hypothetical protein